MPINWDSLPMLIGPRFRQIQAERDNRDRLSQLRSRRAKGPKKHSTNKERSFLDREKASRIKLENASRLQQRKTFVEAVKAYWRGELDQYPRQF